MKKSMKMKKTKRIKKLMNQTWRSDHKYEFKQETAKEFKSTKKPMLTKHKHGSHLAASTPILNVALNLMKSIQFNKAEKDEYSLFGEQVAIKLRKINSPQARFIVQRLYYPFEFASVVKIFGRSKQYVIFKEEEWIQFHEQRENINKYFQTFDTMWKPRQICSKTLTFEMIEEKKILKIEDMSGNEVYLGWESVSEVWSLESVFRYRLSYSSGSNFKYFYEDVIRAVAEMSGDVKINIYNIINRLSEKSDDVCCMLEVLLFMPEKALFDVQLERRIQEQEIRFIKKMWMLYAQEHWTKAFDLKSAVEHLYEELGALEFDADHEVIYGMERYYTVQQCEELRDKYKIGRKVCRKFLQGKTCSQCLVKRISQIGLRHFLDTINKYIKDCSDSSSYDEEVFKAVEQNGEETTEEEE
ncbi:hypothetical protein FQA39_LY09194 [Lamprigera yunnana]|nr:hypothetical protein FQA39_LY09194 [Lamprigera yunnana]